LTGISRLQHRRILSQFLENAAQRVADQGMIVEQENLHLTSPFEARAQRIVESRQGTKPWFCGLTECI
jgi:hypothetical protein